MQLGPPGFPNGPSPTQVDARGVGVGSGAELDAPVGQMPGARPGAGKRSAIGTGPSGGVSSGVLADVDSGVRSVPEPAETVQPIAPSVGISGNPPWGMAPQVSGPTAK